MSPDRRRALILEDNSLTLETLTDYLRAPGLDLVACSEIEAAECLLDRDEFDVLVTDLEVSDLGGLEGIRLIRHVTCHFPETQVIVFSGKIDGTVHGFARALGITELLEKPAGLRRLRELVHTGVPLRGDRPPERSGDVTHVETVDELLESRSISAVLQPIVTLDPELEATTTFGVEGLSRGPKGSLLRNPEIFLDYASRKEKLFEIELQCVEAVLAEGNHLPKVGKLFINTRARSLSASGFAPELRSLARDHGYHESDIVLELTEQESALNLGAFDEALNTLHDYGFALALDDYGSGFANLHQVQQLPLDYVKIDGRFCIGIHEDLRKQAIVRSTVELTRELGISTIMERVETEDELSVVQELGVDYAQGYYFSAPIPGRELATSFQPIEPTSPVELDALVAS